MTELFGLSSANMDALFPKFLSGVHEEDRDRFLASIRDAAERCALWNFEGRFVKPSGEIIWFHGLSTPTRREDRVVFDGMLLNITDRKQAEEALEKRFIALTKPLDDVSGIAFEDLFNIADIQRLQDEFADATGVASIITHTDGTPITRPSRFCHFCIGIVRKTEKGLVNCYRSDAVLGRLSTKGPAIQPCMSGGLWDAGAGISVGGRHIANWLIGQVRDATQTEEKIRAYAREIGTDEEALVEAFREVPSMSQERFQQVSQALFTLANQLSAFAYQNVQQARFITERKQAEEKFYKVFMTTPDCILITRMKDGRIIEANQGFEEIVGWERDEAVGRTSLEIGFWANPGDRNLMVRDLKSGRDILHREFQFGRRDGTVRTGVYSARLVHIADEACLVFVLQDITDQRHLEEERRKLEQQLFQSQKMDAIGQLAGGIAHDFNNILLAVSGNAKLAAMDLPTDHPLQDAMAEIIKGCNRGTDLVRQILLFSRPQKQEHKVIRLQDVVKEALKLVRSTIPAMISIETEFDPRAPSIIADAGQIHQIVVNLATNAAQAIGPKSGCIRCTIDETVVREATPELLEGRYVRLSMADDGCGIEQEIIDRIFDPFFTTKATGQGTGLGLSVVHGIMKGVGGGIVVQSEVGKGSVFSLYFPASDTDAEVELTKALPQDTAVAQSLRVLYVDDDSSLVLLIKRMLERGGYRVTGFTDPARALTEFLASPDAYDVVVTDLAMPGISGFSFAVELLAASPDTPVFMTSGYVRQEDEEKARQIGIKALILKPNTLEELQHHLKQLFDAAIRENRS
jgi:PAS domain S-box-containing protein